MWRWNQNAAKKAAAAGLIFQLLLAISAPVVAAESRAADEAVVVEGGCRLILPSRFRTMAKTFEFLCNDRIPSVFEQLGVDPMELYSAKGQVQIRVVESPSEMSKYAPHGVGLPKWSSAITFSDQNLVLLPLLRQDGGPNDDLEVTLLHEVSHVAFHRASGGAQVPRWFSEGVAILQSEGSSVGRKGMIWWASMVDSLPSLASIEQYPEGAADAGNAYAMAADFTASLVELEGWSGIRYLTGMLLEGRSFNDAFDRTYGMSIARAEETWRANLFGGTEWITVVTGSSALWGAAVVLFIVAWSRARRRKRERLAQMAREEAPLEQVIATLSSMAEEQMAPEISGDAPPQQKSDPDDATLLPKRRGMPTRISIGGRIHTLH